MQKLGDMRYKCLLCGRDKFTQKSPHCCRGGFRKRNIEWTTIPGESMNISFDFKAIKKTYQRLYNSPLNKYQSLCLELIEMLEEKEHDPLRETCVMRSVLIREDKELIISLGRGMGSSTLIKAIHESHPEQVVVGLRNKRMAKRYNYREDAFFSLNDQEWRQMSLGDTDADIQTDHSFRKKCANKVIIMDMGKQLILDKPMLTNNMINCLYNLNVAGIIWLGV